VIEILYRSPWPGALLWTVLFISDHSFTIACARMYQAGVREHFVFEGSYELTPFHQRDVNALRRFSPRFAFALLVPWVLLPLAWLVANTEPSAPVMYEIILGAIVLAQLTVHVRHVRNYSLFRAILAGAISGRIEYPRRMLLTQSSIEMFAFAAVYAVVFVLTANSFVLGGAFACFALGCYHLLLARQPAAKPAAAG
jgi:hypothetical protein